MIRRYMLEKHDTQIVRKFQIFLHYSLTTVKTRKLQLKQLS